MAIPITVPRLGWNMEEGTFGGWLKGDGDPVKAGDRLFALESDKATEEVECLDAGTLRIPADGPKPGDRLAVGAVIGYLDSPATADLMPPSPVPRAGSPKPPVSTPSAPRPPDPVASPAVRRLARERGIDLQAVRGSGPGGRISADDLPARRPPVTPRARRAARELGLDPTSLRGTGRNGRVRERDVRSAPPVDGGSLLPITPIRRTIATRMVESLRQTAPVTLTTTADATNLVNLREQFRSVDADLIPSYTDLLLKLTAVALRDHPLLTGRWTDAGLHLPDAIHLGFAVDTDTGLLVPVVRDVLGQGVRDLAATTRGLIDRARAGKLSAADMQGGCFTVTNLGAFGVDAFTPIINYPECAILGVGRIARRPAVVGDAVVPRDQVTLSLTFDHRVLDGAPAARFLQTLSQAIENPAPRLVT